MLLLLLFLIPLAVIFIFFIRSLSLPNKIKKAEVLLEAGETSKAGEIIKRILDKKKDYVPAKYIRAEIYISQNQYLLAISELNNILAITGFDRFVREIDIHYHLARLYNQTSNFTKEIEEYKLILNFNPDDVVANHRLGHALYSQKEYRKAKEHLMKAVLIDPALIDVYLPIGVSCFQISDYDNSEEYLLKSMKFNGDHSEAEYYIAMIYKMKKDYDNAVKMFENAVKNKKYFLKSLQRLGEIYYDQGQYSTAITYLERGLNNLADKSEESHSYRYLLAECYEYENKIKEAVHHWNKIVLENPSFRSTKMKLESYRDILDNEYLMTLFQSSLEELQPTIIEMITNLNYNVISRERINTNEYQYKAFNIKRINEPPLLIYFNRTTREISEGHVINFHKIILNEKCRTGIYIATSRFSTKAKQNANSKMIELYDIDFVNKSIEKIISRKKH